MKEANTPTQDEARVRRTIHVVGALLVLLVVVGVIWGAMGGSEWLRKRQLRAIQFAAKADLQMVFDAERTFHATYGFYTTDLKALNLWPKRVLYTFGFVKPGTVAKAQALSIPELDSELRTIALLAAKRADDAIAKSKNDPNVKPEPPILLSPLTKIAAIDFNRLVSFCPDCTASQDKFKVVAAADLDSDPVLDVWTIDESGAIRHVIDDLQ